MAVATGRTAHDSFPTTGRLEPGPEGGAFVTKLAAGGRRIVYSTVLGGADPSNSSNTAFAVALDRDSQAYVTGITSAPDFPTVRALQPRYSAMRSNAFVTKIDARGTRLAYSTFLGGGTEDEGLGIAVDGAGSAYVTGHTSSADFPLAGPPLPGLATGDGSDAFVAKLAPGGRTLVYSVLLGGSGEDAGNAIAVNRFGNAFVAGTTTAPDFPVTPRRRAAADRGRERRVPHGARPRRVEPAALDVPRRRGCRDRPRARARSRGRRLPDGPDGVGGLPDRCGRSRARRPSVPRPPAAAARRS